MANGPVRHTKQKDAVMAQLRGCDDFISAQELHRKLVDSGLRIGLATVYRQLNSLVDSGAADTVRMDGQQLFRLCGDDAHHHHLVCRKCGKTIEIDPPSESWLRKVADGHGFTVESHTLEVFGLCPRLSGKTLTFPRIRPCWRRAVGRGLTGVVRRRGTRARRSR